MYFRKPRGSLFGNAVMSQEEIDRFLGERHCATLGYQNVNGFPGVAPVNYAWDGKAFYLHCARKGERYESLLRNQKVALNVYHDANDEADENGMAEHLSVTAYAACATCAGKRPCARWTSSPTRPARPSRPAGRATPPSSASWTSTPWSPSI